MKLFHHQNVKVSQRGIRRRSFLHRVSAGAIAAGTLGFRDLVSLQAEELRKRHRSMILLWMAGGPSQFETFDPKPGTTTAGPTKAIRSSVPGIQVAQGWEPVAKTMKDIAIIRSMTNKEGSHPRASYQMHTGYIPSGSVKHPSLSACVAQQISTPESDLPSVVSVGNTFGAGFLGVDYEPFAVRTPGELPQNLALATDSPRYKRRLQVLDRLEDEFAARGAAQAVESHRKLYGKTAKLALSSSVDVFRIDKEPQALRDRYGDTEFGKGCLLARRLVESGVSFVEIRSSGWDNHADVFETVSTNAAEVAPGFATLVEDLKDRGLLDSTLVVWMGEFGRTPRVNARGGRDHYPRVFNAAMAGGGVRGGQVIGASTRDGSQVKDGPVTVHDLFQTACKSLKVDPNHENISPLGRPMKIVDGGKVIPGIFG